LIVNSSTMWIAPQATASYNFKMATQGAAGLFAEYDVARLLVWKLVGSHVMCVSRTRASSRAVTSNTLSVKAAVGQAFGSWPGMSHRRITSYAVACL